MSLLFADLHRGRTKTASANLDGCGYDKMVVVVAVVSEGTAWAWMDGCMSMFVGNPSSGLFAWRVGELRAKMAEEVPRKLLIQAQV